MYALEAVKGGHLLRALGRARLAPCIVGRVLVLHRLTVALRSTTCTVLGTADVAFLARTAQLGLALRTTGGALLGGARTRAKIFLDAVHGRG